MPSALLAIGLCGPRTPSGASGFMSNMSMCDGPPHWKRKITDFARALGRLPDFASAASSFGNVSPSHVLDVVGHGLVVGEVGTAVDLRQTGDARLQVVAAVVLRRVLLDQLRDLRAGADDAHVAHQHVPEVRQFVEASRAEKAANAG